MKMKKIIAPTMTQAIEKVKKELGNDAVIFHTKKVKNGRFFNLFKKENIEVLAASDTEQDFALKTLPKSTENRDEMLTSLSGKADRLPFRRTMDKVDRLFSGPENIDRFRRRLNEQGLNERHIDEQLKMLVKKWYQSDEKLTEAELVRLLRAQLIQKLDPRRFQSPILPNKYVMLIGPTGVGKTTTIAKLAGRAVLDEGKRVAFITSDTFRVAAIDQLKMYADILDVPIDVAYSEKDFHGLIEKYADFDHVFIDTAGRNFQNKQYVQELARLIDDDRRIGLYLVISATSKYEDINAMIEQFDQLPVDRVIVSKIDETQTYGAIVSTLLNHPQKAIAYITNGQNVPDDLQAPNVRELINHMLGDINEQ
ncbi:AAA family ATPase [Sporolactobacillus putidus]|uniref:Flagellar biosynthesis protein FlhF n=1 Tax=Sporolactobacillus putidus TaxID=492735 RepID=A0A917RY73_9BACL|nr:flagellar biosynthesis protein FlhF [Sporolactobacillus putidus]GGL44014.1 flagellar biosynthesis protein FlhF [Sporolactobacillus putidus]